MTTLMEVREVREATLVTMAIIRSSWLIRAVSLLGGAEMELGPEEGVGAISAGREGCGGKKEDGKGLVSVFPPRAKTKKKKTASSAPQLCHSRSSRSSSYLEVLVH